MAKDPAKKLGVLQRGLFDQDTYHMWRCASCNRFFAAEEPTIRTYVVGMVGWQDPYPENRKLNKVRAAWARARDRGDVCTCEFHANWRTADDLHVRLPESRAEDPMWNKFNLGETDA